MNESHRPDFSRFQITSIAARNRWSRMFLYLCLATSTLSIVILFVLISTIIISALPVFGPHEDTILASSRTALLQSEGNDQSQIDNGDLIQGMFQANKLVGGGLGKANDEQLVSKDGKKVERLAIGFYSMQVASATEGSNVCKLEAAEGQQNVSRLLKELGLAEQFAEKLAASSSEQAASLVVITSDKTDFDFGGTEIKGPMLGSELFDALKTIDDWKVHLVASVVNGEGNDDFAEIRFQETNKGEVKALKKTRARRKAAHFRILASVIYSEDGTEQFQPVGLRSYSDSKVYRGHLKLDGELAGVSRRKRKGFDFGGDVNVQWCPLNDDRASAAEHFTTFLKEVPSNSDAAVMGIGPSFWGSIWVCTICALFALPLGIATAVFLEEFKPTNRVLRVIQSIIQLNITNLAGVPSIVYGILGLTAFATMFGMFTTEQGSDLPGFQVGAEYYYQYLSEGMNPVLVKIDDPSTPPTLVSNMTATDGDYNSISLNVIGPNDDPPEDEATLKWTLRSDAVGGLVTEKPWYYFQLPFGRGVLAASLTLMLVILPVIIIASQEAIRAVPSSLRQAAMGLGTTPWQVVRSVTLPAAIPGIMTGAILAISRAIGEAAPIVVLCGTVFIASSPQHLMDFYSVLPIQIFYLTSQPVGEEGLINFQHVAAASSLVLLVVLLTFNTVAIVLRQLTQKPLS